MKRFKLIDLWVSIALIIFFIIRTLIKNDLEDLLIAYVFVGGWQVISMLVHVFTKTFTYWKGVRSMYHWTTLLLLVTIPVGSIWILLFTAPFMAVFYTWLCYHELSDKMERPLAQLR